MKPFFALLGAVAAAWQPIAVAGQTTPLPQVSASSSGRVGYMTGAELAAKCKDQSLDSVAQCFAYLAAVHDTVRAYETWLRIREFCMPAKIAQSDLRKTLVAYVESAPDAADGQAASVAIRAMKQQFPCPDAVLTPPVPGQTNPPPSQKPR